MPAILVVDDDHDTRCNMADLLGDLGYEIATADGGEAALQEARRRSYGLGLLDLRMPGMDGLTLCRHLRELDPTLVAMIVTAGAGGGLAEEARAAGARCVIAKPLDIPRMLNLIGQVLPPVNGGDPPGGSRGIGGVARQL